MAKITYLPKDGDGLKTVFHGHKFEANKPIEVSHALLIRQASKNSWFKVEGATAEQLADPTEVPEAAPADKAKAAPHQNVKSAKDDGDKKPKVYDPNTDLPTTSEQYRGFALAWIKTVDESEAMDLRWKEEEELRQKCGWGSDDEEYLATFFNQKRTEMVAAEQA
jgi:hypothetical protein